MNRVIAHISWFVATIVLGLLMGMSPFPSAWAGEDIATLRAQAKAGDPEAQYKLGGYYVTKHEGRISKKALHWIRMSALQGFVPAENFLGNHYMGLGLPRNLEKSFKWFRLAAHQGNDYAQVQLGNLYRNGQGTFKDYNKAAHWYRLAAHQGNAWGQTSLGWLYEYGQGVSQSFEKAFHWYRLGVESSGISQTMAQYKIGVFYELGQGVPQDYEKAYKWLILAKSSNFQMAAPVLHSLMSHMTPGQIAEGQRLARQWTSAKKSSAPPFEARANSSQPSTSEKASPAPPSPDLSEIKQLIEAQNNEIHSLKARNETSSSKSSAPVYHTSVDSPSFHESENRRLFAVVVGVEHYPGGIHDAPFADRDAQAVYRHLRALGVPPDHIRKLTDDIATQGRIRGAVRWLARNAKPDSTLWIYFSGHGAPTSKGVAYLVPFGGDPSDLEDTAYSLSALYNQLNKIHAHRIIVALDSCFSGEGKRSVLAHGAKPLVLHIKTGSVPSSGKLIVLSGAKGDQEAGVLEKKGHGIFTYYLLKGLDGGAVRGGHVTVASLYEYLKTRVTDAANLNDGNQTPVLQPVLSKDGNIRLR